MGRIGAVAAGTPCISSAAGVATVTASVCCCVLGCFCVLCARLFVLLCAVCSVRLAHREAEWLLCGLRHSCFLSAHCSETLPTLCILGRCLGFSERGDAIAALQDVCSRGVEPEIAPLRAKVTARLDWLQKLLVALHDSEDAMEVSLGSLRLQTLLLRKHTLRAWPSAHCCQHSRVLQSGVP